MFSTALLTTFSLVVAGLALEDATCGTMYGTPSPVDCNELLGSLRMWWRPYDKINRFMGIAKAQGSRPSGVPKDAWDQRITVPSVHSNSMKSSHTDSHYLFVLQSLLTLTYGW